MKNLILTLTIVLSCFIMAGCDKTIGCKTSHWPEPGISINWDGCNDVETVLNYFDCHDSALYKHYNNTIEIRGYIKRDYFWMFEICSDTAFVPENSIPLNLMEGSPVPIVDSTQLYKLTGRIRTAQTTGKSCCNVSLEIDILKIEEL